MLQINAVSLLRFKGKAVPVFLMLGLAGWGFSFVCGWWLTQLFGLSLGITLCLSLLSALIFFAVIKIRELIWKDGDLVYYHHEIAIFAATILFLVLMGKPVHAYLDIMGAGIGLFLAFGRIGCSMAGCCHGLPHTWGICYGADHLADGFPRSYFGIPLFPVQMVESLMVFTIVALGVFIRLQSGIPGTLFVFYILWYNVGRFVLEFFRGDQGRPYYLGLSQAQWISVVLTWILIAEEIRTATLFEPYHLVLALLLTAAMLYRVVGHWQKSGTYATKLDADHFIELADMVRHFEENRLYNTSRGLQVSFGTVYDDKTPVFHLTLSGLENSAEGKAIAIRLADIVFKAKQYKLDKHRITENQPGVFQFISRISNISKDKTA